MTACFFAKSWGEKEIYSKIETLIGLKVIDVEILNKRCKNYSRLPTLIDKKVSESDKVRQTLDNYSQMQKDEMQEIDKWKDIQLGFSVWWKLLI